MASKGRPRVAHTDPIRLAQLLAVLLVFHVTAPVVSTAAPRDAGLLLVGLYLVVLGSAAVAMTRGKRRLVLAAMAIPMLVAGGFTSIERPGDALLVVASALPYIAYTSVVVFGLVLRAGVVNEAKLLASASVFILMAQCWASLYAGVEWLAPGSFRGPMLDGEPVAVGTDDLVYFSLVTQTTLGYGDITPATPIARALTTLQALVGLFYMGVVVARFAGRLALSRAVEAGADR